MEEDFLLEVKDIPKTYDCMLEVSDCEIKFKNKIIKFWSPFLNQINEGTIRNLELLETSINEKTLFSVLIGKDVEIPFLHLPDYYFLFKVLKLKHCIASINRKIEKTNNMKDIYLLFKEFCLKYENITIKSWFSEDMKKIERIRSTIFDTSFALSLFNKMKKMENEKKKKSIRKKKCPFFVNIKLHLEKYEVIKVINHKDFEGVGFENELNLVGLFFKNLYENLETNSNLTLISTDKKEFKVHKEMFVLRYDYFLRLFKFRGLEVTEYNRTGKITLRDLMSSDVVESLIKYAYLGEIEIRNEGNEGIQTIKTFIKLLVFCDLGEQFDLMKKVHSKFSCFVSCFKPRDRNNEVEEEMEIISESEKILGIIYELSSYLFGNRKVLRVLFPLINKLGVKISGVDEFIEVLVNQSLGLSLTVWEMKRDMVKKEVLEDVKKKNLEEKEKLEERILELEKMVEEMKEENDKGVGKGQIRDREEEEGDEDKDKDQPERKKRKINRK